MGIFDKIRYSEQNDKEAKFIKEIKKIYLKEGLPINEAALEKTYSEFSNIKVYFCKNKCPMVIHIGESTQVECPTCGNFLEFVESDFEDAGLDKVKSVIAAEGHLAHGSDLMQKGKLDLALSAFTRAIQLNPDLIDAYHNRSAVRGMMDDPERAIEDCGHVIRLNPEDSGAYFNQGTAKGQMGKFEEAIEDISKALSLGYDKPVASFNRGIFALRAGKIREAVVDLKKFLEREPSSKHADFIRNILSEAES